MKNEYDFSKSRKNPYAAKLRKPVTMRIDITAVAYFKELAAEWGIPYQNLINLFLVDCASQGRKPSIHWPSPPPSVTTRRAKRS